LLKANQESMERRVELGDANMKLLSENTELKEKHSQIIQGLATENNNLKARCEALTLEVSQLEKDLGVANATVYLQKETRDDLMKQIKGLKEIIADLEAGEGKQSIWSKIKNLCN
jgi:cell division protein FtsB